MTGMLRRHKRQVWIGLFVAVLVVWGLTDVRKRAHLDPNDVSTHRTDVTVYTGAGAAFFQEGVDPYLVESPRGWHYLYPPLFAIAVAPLATLPPSEQGLVFYLISLLFVYGCLHETSRIASVALCGRPVGWFALLKGDVPRWVVWTAGLAVFFPLFNCLQRAQVAPFTLYPLLAGTRLVIERKSRAWLVGGGVVLALPVAIKLTPLLPVAFVGWVLWLRALLGWKAMDSGGRAGDAATVTAAVGAGLALWLFFVPAAFIGWNQNLNHLSTWVERVAANQSYDEENQFFAASRRNQSFQNGARLLLGSVCDKPALQEGAVVPDGRFRSELNAKIPDQAIDRALFIARVAMMFLLILVGGVSLAATGTALTVAVALGLGAVGSVVFSPLSWGHHYAIIWPAAIFVPLLFLRAGRTRVAKVFAVSAAALTVGHYAFMSQLGPIGMLGVGMAVWFVAATIVLAQTVRGHKLILDSRPFYGGEHPGTQSGW